MLYQMCEYNGLHIIIIIVNMHINFFETLTELSLKEKTLRKLYKRKYKLQSKNLRYVALKFCLHAHVVMFIL